MVRAVLGLPSDSPFVALSLAGTEVEEAQDFSGDKTPRRTYGFFPFYSASSYHQDYMASYSLLATQRPLNALSRAPHGRTRSPGNPAVLTTWRHELHILTNLDYFLLEALHACTNYTTD
jgi:hypothetical protein